MNYYEPQTLIVVYQDELHVNQLKKLVETKDDGLEDTIGTKDGSVQIVAWSEKVWLEQKKAGNINNKVLFIGDVRGTDKLIPVVDVVFEEYGVKYGWAGNQAIIWVEPKQLEVESNYNAFLEKLRALPVPNSLKKGMGESYPLPTVHTPNNIALLSNIINTFVNLSRSIKNSLEKRVIIKQQMLFFGIINLYNNDLERFMQA